MPTIAPSLRPGSRISTSSACKRDWNVCAVSRAMRCDDEGRFLASTCAGGSRSARSNPARPFRTLGPLGGRRKQCPFCLNSCRWVTGSRRTVLRHQASKGSSQHVLVGTRPFPGVGQLGLLSAPPTRASGAYSIVGRLGTGLRTLTAGNKRAHLLIELHYCLFRMRARKLVIVKRRAHSLMFGVIEMRRHRARPMGAGTGAIR
jgi:hypothetical protein